MQKNVRIIPRKPTLAKPKRVAAYARVSTGKDAMLHSLSAQISAYSAMIQQHPGWQYAGVYSDEALTGTKDDRAAFQRLLSDCRSGQIDMVITKSVSRFARNTVHMLETVRELTALGVDVFFEEENIHRISSDGELMLTMEGAHEAIIAPEQFDAVQEEFARRSKIGRAYSDKAFHSKLICGDCGAFYGRKVWHSTDEYRSVVFQCNSKFKAPTQCRTPALTEEAIKTRFLAAYDKLIGKRDSIIADCEEIRKMLCSTADIEASIQREQEEMDVLAQMMQAHVMKNATVALNQDEYNAETQRIESRYNAAMDRASTLEGELGDRKRRSKEIRAFIMLLSTQPRVLMEWDDRVWITLLDTATIQTDGSIAFRFKCGTVITN